MGEIGKTFQDIGTDWHFLNKILNCQNIRPIIKEGLMKFKSFIQQMKQLTEHRESPKDGRESLQDLYPRDD